MSKNKCIHELDCVNFGVYDNCNRESTTPICCCHFDRKPATLKNVSTSDLVRELAGREGVDVDDADCGKIEIIYSDVSLGKIVDCNEGPATILIVRGERE